MRQLATILTTSSMNRTLSATQRRLPETRLSAANDKNLPTEVLTIIVGNAVAACLDDVIQSDEKASKYFVIG